MNAADIRASEQHGLYISIPSTSPFAANSSTRFTSSLVTTQESSQQFLSLAASMMFPPTSLCLTAILAATAAAAPSLSTIAACRVLSAVIPKRVWSNNSLSADYSSEVNSYWSTALREAKPACLVLPQSAQEVATAVKVLKKYPDVQFAVKSGGHTPNERHSSIKDGVLISTRDLSGVTYDKNTQIASVKPGGDWDDVIGPLDEQGVAIVGGRLGMVLLPL